MSNINEEHHTLCSNIEGSFAPEVLNKLKSMFKSKCKNLTMNQQELVDLMFESGTPITRAEAKRAIADYGSVNCEIHGKKLDFEGFLRLFRDSDCNSHFGMILKRLSKDKWLQTECSIVQLDVCHSKTNFDSYPSGRSEEDRKDRGLRYAAAVGRSTAFQGRPKKQKDKPDHIHFK